VICFVDQEKLKTRCCPMPLNLWSLLLIFLCIFGYVFDIVPFGVFRISHFEVLSDMLLTNGVSISGIPRLANIVGVLVSCIP